MDEYQLVDMIESFLLGPLIISSSENFYRALENEHDKHYLLVRPDSAIIVGSCYSRRIHTHEGSYLYLFVSDIIFFIESYYSNTLK